MEFGHGEMSLWGKGFFAEFWGAKRVRLEVCDGFGRIESCAV